MDVPPPKRRGPPVVILLPVLLACIVLPFLFWQGTWFGAPLSDEEIITRLTAILGAGVAAHSDDASLRHAQHALEQISKRMEAARRSNGPKPSKLYPHVVALVGHPAETIRETVAWLMQEDRDEPSFGPALRTLVEDASPLVRRNAALGLARRGDAVALPVLRAMLMPFTVRADCAGEVTAVLGAGDRVLRGGNIARIRGSNGREQEIVSPVLAGTVTEVLVKAGGKVTEGQPVCRVSPSKQEVYYALIGLSVLGTAEDLVRVARYVEPSADADRRITEQAKRTRDSIRARIEAKRK